MSEMRPQEKNTAPSSEGQGSSTSDLTSDPKSKIKKFAKRSIVWQHFTEYYDPHGVRRSKCNYCGKDYASASKRCGTTTLKSHMESCTANPNNIKSAQTQLTCSSIRSEEGKINLIPWKFDQEGARKALAEMIIIDELPFKFVEGIGFRRYMQKCQPAHIIPSRTTIRRDCYQLFLDEKAKLKSQIKNTSLRICLTTDTWTSLQRINYMCLTAHFIDNDWKLQKKVLNFCPVSSHRGREIGKALEMSLVDWGLQNVLTITVDNASSNDVALDYIKKKIVNWEGSCVLQGKWTHIRCVAHILNLVVQNGLEELGESVERVRSAVKYVRQSPARLTKFMSYAEIEKCDSKKSLCLDVSTRWNSTYLMLSVAQTYERAFDRLSVEDSTFSDDLDSHGSKLGIPTSLDWKNINRLVIFLQHFYELTLRISGTKYVTANTFLDDISCIHGILEDCLSSDDDELVRMAAQMKMKFDKYWGSFEKFNMLVFIASMLDPRNKFEYIEIVLKNMYGDENGSSLAEKVKNAFFELFNEYKRIYSSSACASSSSFTAVNSSILALEAKEKPSVGVEPLNKLKEKFRAELKKRKLNDGVRDSKSELDKYLAEDDDDDETNSENFSVLGWWKINSPRFPILSLVARDILAIPISTVASESVFSTGGRVLDSFRSSLTPKIAQALICCQDWIRSSTTPINVEENIEELENFERDLKQSVPESTCVDI